MRYGYVSFIVLLLLINPAWLQTDDDSRRDSQNIITDYQRHYEGTESREGVQFYQRAQRKPLDATTEAYREARRQGDFQKMRELESQFRRPASNVGESQGELTRRQSTTVGYPGEPVSDGNQGLSPDWGSDIKVRGPNTTFRESYPAMATASNGDIYVAWENVGSTQPHDYIQIYKSSDGGSTWTAFGFFENPSFNLSQPSMAIGEGNQDFLVIAYVVNDAVPFIEVATTPLTSASFTMVTPAYYTFWEGYSKPSVWTDSYEWNAWYIYLTAEAAFNSAANNYNVVFWRSTDFGATYTDPAQVPLGNLDADAWRDPDGTYGGFGNDVFVACFNATDNMLYTIISQNFGSSWSDTIAINTVSPLPVNPVDPDIEAATSHNNIMLTCTKGSTTSGDNIAQTYSTDGGQTWTTLFTLEGFTNLNEWGADLTANEGGGSWHLAYTSNNHVFYSTRPQDLSDFWQLVPDVVDDNQTASNVYTKKGITSNWTSDEPGIAWADFRDGTPDYDIYFDRNGQAQLYQGPASGNIAGGVLQNTNNFIANKDQEMQPPRAIPRRDLDRILREAGENPIQPTGPVGSNEVDDPAISPDPIEAPNLIIDFAGIPYDGVFPPDPHMAAGPNHIMGVVNSQFAIYDKNGTLQKLIDADDWYQSLLTNTFPCDPQVVYDHHSGRFIMIWIECGGGSPSLFLSVSDDSDPNGFWCNWRLPGDQNGSIFNGLFNDYPKIGVDQDAVYVTANMFGAGFQYVQLRVIPKAQLLGGCGAVIWKDFWDLRNPSDVTQTTFTTVPAVTFGAPGVEYLVDVDAINATGTFVNLWELTNPLDPVPGLTATTVPVNAFNSPPNAQQLGGGGLVPIDVGGRRCRNVVYKDGSVWTAHSVADASGQYARARYVRLDASSKTTIEDISFGATDFWYFYPAVHPDGANNLVMAFSRSGLNEYAGARYTGRLDSDPPGLQASALLKAGEDPYQQIDGVGRNRWGDYLGIALDPADNTKVWMFQEYAAPQVSGFSRWGTWFGEVSFVQPPDIAVSPTSFSFTLPVGGTDSDVLTISNTAPSGSDDLIWNIFEQDVTLVLSMVEKLPISGRQNEMNLLPTPAGNSADDSANPTNNSIDFVPGAYPPSIGSAPTDGFATTTIKPPTGTLRFPGNSGFGIESQAPAFNQLDLDIPEVLNFIAAPTGTGGFSGAGAFGLGDQSFAYQLDSDNYFAEIDTSTGAATVLPSPTPPGTETWSGLETDPTSGILYAISTDVATSTLSIINPTTGAVTNVGVTGMAGAIALAIDGNGNMWSYDIVTDEFFSVNKNTGVATSVGPLGFDANFGQGMAWDVRTNQVYMAAFNNSTFQAELRIVNTSNGSSTLVGVLGATVPGGLRQLGWLAIPGAGADCPWLTASPTSGTTPPGSNDLVNVNVDATGLAAGTYNCDLIITSNDPDENPVIIPVTLNVAACTPGILGDVNGDGLANSTDALIIQSFDAGLPIPQPILDRINLGFGDGNGDGFTNSTDALLMLSFDVGIPIPFPVGDPVCL